MKKPQLYSFGLNITRVLIFSCHLFLDQQTLDFPVLHLHTGFVGVIRDEYRKDKWGNPTGIVRIKCVGIIFRFGFWFFQTEIIFTPIYFRVKTKT